VQEHIDAWIGRQTPGFSDFSVEMSKKRDARRNFSQYLEGNP
jgi:hypothetical protein